MTVADGLLVGFSYVLTDAEGVEIDRSTKEDPFYYLHGKGQVVPGLEAKLTGMQVGDTSQVFVPAVDAYGEVIEDLCLSVGREQFPEDVELQVGMEFTADIGNGQKLPFRVVEIEGESVAIDGNHPLAGEDLNFQVEICEVREPTSEELASFSGLN